MFSLLLLLVVNTGAESQILHFSLTERYALSTFPGEGGFGRISDVSYSLDLDEILVADEVRRRIFTFKSDGTPEQALGVATDIPPPSATVPGGDGKVYIVEARTGKLFTLNRVEGEQVVPFRITGEKIMDEVRVSGLVRSRAGVLYLVTDDGKQIIMCDGEGHYRGMSDRGVRLGRLIAIDVDDRGRIIAATRGLIPLRLFDGSGSFLRNIEIRDLATDMSRSEIGGVAFDAQGRVWLTYPVDGLVRVFDETGTLLDEIGSSEIPGGLFSPADIEITPMGDLLILERGSNRVRCFSMELQ